MITKLTEKEYFEKLKNYSDYHFSCSEQWISYQNRYFNKTDLNYFLFSFDSYNSLIKLAILRTTGGIKFASITYGPIFDEKLFTDKDNLQKAFKMLLKELKDEYIHKVCFIQISPSYTNELKNSLLNDILNELKEVKTSIRSQRYLDGTLIIDLKKEYKEIESYFRKDVKYNLKKVNKEGLLTYSELYSYNKDVEEYLNVYYKESKNRAVKELDKQFYINMLDNEDGFVSLVKKNNEIVSGMFIIKSKYNNGLIAYSSFVTEEGKKHKAAVYNRDQIIHNYSSSKANYFDFYDYSPQRESLANFKAGFSGKVFVYPKSVDLILDNIEFQYYKLIVGLGKFKRKL